ncbi:MAG TPA: WYL domain-containing protein, partial [Anaeromyxobacteraceae bacterium]|nr:WYL domain-containing protein [Anaeromyxobacteraceae bacterium]
MKRAERLLDLAAYLLRATKPVSWGAIRDHFSEDYGCSEEAAIRKFERDKSELVELGVPVRWVKGEEELETGYLIDRDEFYLPNLELEPEDLVLLYMAGSAALAQGVFPYARDLSHALNKLSFAARAAGASEAAALAAESLSRGAEGEMAWPGANGTTSRKFEKLSAAVAAKKRIHLKYCGAERGVV